MQRETLKARRRVLVGVDAAPTLLCEFSLAESLFNQGKHTEAAELLRRVLAVFQRACGSHDEFTLRAAFFLPEVQAAAKAKSV